MSSAQLVRRCLWESVS